MNGFKILVVDDTAELFDLTRRVLKKAGYKVFSASSGAECLQYLHDSRPDLILLDVMLPDINGKDLIKNIKSNTEFSSIYIILFSSLETSPGNNSSGLEEGADEYIIRPVNNRELVARVEAARRIITSERALEASVHKWQITFDGITDSVFILDEEGIILQANKRSTELLQKTETELLGQHCYSIVHCSSGHIDNCPFMKMKKSKKRETMLLSVGDKWFNVIVDPIYDEANNLQGAVHFISDITEQKLTDDNNIPIKLIGTISDITDRKRAEETLKKSEEKYRLLAENISDVIWILDPDTMRFLYVSPSVERLRGHTTDEILSQPLSASLLEASADDIINTTRNRVKAFLSGGEAPVKYYTDEIKQPHKNGSVILTEAISSYYINSENGRVEILGVSRDITDRRKAEEQVQKLNAELEQRVIERTTQLEDANKELQAFAYSVSHDLRAPLRAIDGFSKFVLEGYGPKLDSEGKRLLGMIRANTQKMDLLITDILALSRVSRSVHKVSRIDMTKMALSMLNEVASGEILKKIDITINTLPEVQGDPIYIKQVWINIISNAIKFSSNKRKPEIEISGYTENDFNVYFVRDNGVGFDPDYSDKLFGVFQRLHKSDEFEGTGVGLAIVQRIIHRHGGKVWAEGKVGKGAKFYFSLPGKNT